MQKIDIAIRRTALLMRATVLADFPHEEIAFWSISPGHDGHGVEDVRAKWTDDCWQRATNIGGFGPGDAPLDVCTAVREDIPDLRNALWKFIFRHRDHARWAASHASDLHDQEVDEDGDYGDEIEATSQEEAESKRLAALAEDVFEVLEKIQGNGHDHREIEETRVSGLSFIGGHRLLGSVTCPDVRFDLLVGIFNARDRRMGGACVTPDCPRTPMARLTVEERLPDGRDLLCWPCALALAGFWNRTTQLCPCGERAANDVRLSTQMATEVSSVYSSGLWVRHGDVRGFTVWLCERCTQEADTTEVSELTTARLMACHNL